MTVRPLTLPEFHQAISAVSGDEDPEGDLTSSFLEPYRVPGDTVFCLIACTHQGLFL